MSFDAAGFRHVLGHFPTGVTIVTAVEAGTPIGFTIGSFTSVSLDPPLVGFLPMKDSTTWARMARSGAFCVNVLGTAHTDLCWSFARSSEDADRFDGVTWHPAPSGSPILDRAVAWIDCTIDTVYDAGDHYFVVGQVDALEAHSDAEAQSHLPLVFYRGQLGVFGAND